MLRSDKLCLAFVCAAIIRLECSRQFLASSTAPGANSPRSIAPTSYARARACSTSAAATAVTSKRVWFQSPSNYPCSSPPSAPSSHHPPPPAALLCSSRAWQEARHPGCLNCNPVTFVGRCRFCRSRAIFGGRLGRFWRGHAAQRSRPLRFSECIIVTLSQEFASDFIADLTTEGACRRAQQRR